ncbi:glycosyltransferase family 4 protein [Pyrobaculum aerophilum]|uniref:glycosyltransferase family 4 protein n=1 Tax=Pyrobaculum aerophilum TaxID=13773 RepID=UPI0023F0D01B|nr:glycosyltransferase family 4 protein [Pyrobaculum aerophilum]MCX8137677.1 glycosyltransferase family 4 protein [Pyrobaculum aerophilum]
MYVHRVKAVRLMGYPDLTYPLELPDLFEDADVAHGHSQNSLFTVKMLQHAKKLGVKTAIRFMAVDALGDHPNPIIRLLSFKCSSAVTKRAVKEFDIHMARSLRDRELLMSRYGARDVHYVPDGVSDHLLNTEHLGDWFRRIRNIVSDYVLYIGRLHPLKGIHYLIKAMKIVSDEVKNSSLVIIGPGDQRPYIDLANRLGIRDRVLFLGYVSDREKIGALDASTALVPPSISNYVEVYPMVISEAWARQKPVIATAVGGIPYRNGENGIMVPPRDAKTPDNAITTLLTDKELARRLGARGKEYVNSWTQVARETLKLYGE